jgi:hypothetical protein
MKTLTGRGLVGGFGDERREDRQQEEFERRLKGARLMTAEVLYYMPDYPSLL